MSSDEPCMLGWHSEHVFFCWYNYKFKIVKNCDA